jgi:L-alanine-DL-glutamate epimerase-like enolase superfamily enzyme
VKPVKLSVFDDRWEMVAPFVTSKEAIHWIDTLTVCINRDGICGKGEALGVDYLGETLASMRGQIEAVRNAVEGGLSREELLELLPPGGARNAVDCALFDLEAKSTGQRAWELAGFPCEPVTTVYTLSLDTPENMALEAGARAGFPVLKLKLDAERIAKRLRAVRSARPDARLIIDANGAWSDAILDSVADVLQACAVEMVEQPLPMGMDADFYGLEYPVPLCADESCQSLADLPGLAGRYHMVNIKLDKCGGLTEALKMVAWCRVTGMQLMVGNMLGSSLAMAPAFLVAQYCRYVDLDGPLWQRTDRSVPMRYEGTRILPPEAGLWG